MARLVFQRANALSSDIRRVHSRAAVSAALLSPQQRYGNRCVQKMMGLLDSANKGLLPPGAERVIQRTLVMHLHRHGNRALALQRQDEFTFGAGPAVSSPTSNENPERVRRLAELQARITGESAASMSLRQKLDALQQSSLTRSQMEHSLGALRASWIALLEERIHLRPGNRSTQQAHRTPIPLVQLSGQD